MEDNLISLLESLGYPVMRQGSLGENQAYPDTFLTFWCNSDDGHSFYDDETVSAVSEYSVFCYSTSPSLAYSVLDSARALLKQNGWIITQRGADAASDEITHIGRQMSVQYLLYANNL